MKIALMFSFPSLVLLLWVVMIWVKEPRAIKAQRMMAVTMLILGISIVLYAQYFNQKLSMPFLVDVLFLCVSVFVAPSYVLFIRSLTSLNGLQKKDWLAFIPSIVFVLFILAIVISMTPIDKYCYVKSALFDRPMAIPNSRPFQLMCFIEKWGFNVFIALDVLIILVWGDNKISKYHEMLENYYATTEGKSITTGRIISICTILIAPVGIAAVLMVESGFGIENNLFTLYFTMIECLLAFMIGYYNYQLTYSAEQLSEMLSEDEHRHPVQTVATNAEIASADMLNSQYTQINLRLKNVMENDKVFLNPDLSIMTLSELLGTNRTYLSRVIHFNYDANFSTYINNLRINYALKLLSETEPGKMQIKELAAECGYRSLSSFHRNFFDITGLTPATWLARNRNA